ncbi:MAG TPA: hypoxanthine phosphoribosyltransferase [Saprospiraceae bacterium]|nr:hypoxanthine phosphoribosyltransferase [Saprospiraceae bacterium]HPN72039.1 hypoxanthine phosphoribosyltransferase [Saprospiraceae bacterium]
MTTLKIDDYIFEPYIDRKQISERARDIAAEMTNAEFDKKPVFLVIMTGAYVFAADLLRLLNFTCEVRFIRVKSYAGMQSTGHFQIESDRLENLEDRNVIILEDIVDTGRTITKIKEVLATKSPKTIKICSLLSKPSAHLSPIDIAYLGFEIPDEFVIGFGLDYNDQGRNLPDIWKVKP